MNPMRLSIRWRLTLWNALAFACILIAFGLGVYLLLRQTHFQMLDKALNQRAQLLATPLENRVPAAEAIGEWIARFGEHGEYSAFVRDSHQHTVGATDGLTEDDVERLLPQVVYADHGTLQDAIYGRLRYAARELNLHGQPYRLYVMAELEHLDEELSLVRGTFLWAIPPALFLTAALSYWLAVRALAPVERLRQNTDSITATDLHQRIPVANNHDEIGHLTQTINSLFARLEQAFEEIKRFSADASHELRTPIAIIRSEAEMCLQQLAHGSRVHARLESILEECARLTELTSQLLVLSRAESGPNQLSLTPVPVDEILIEVISAFEPLATARQVQLLLRDTHCGCAVRGDRESLRQVFHNLIDNAIKYNVPNGSVEVGCQRRDQTVVIEVSDTGRGIPPHDLPRIFERFFRSHSERRPATSTLAAASDAGSGLGLSIVKRIVTNHGGGCQVNSRLNQGTQVCIVLPLA